MSQSELSREESWLICILLGQPALCPPPPPRTPPVVRRSPARTRSGSDRPSSAPAVTWDRPSRRRHSPLRQPLSRWLVSSRVERPPAKASAWEDGGIELGELACTWDVGEQGLYSGSSNDSEMRDHVRKMKRVCLKNCGEDVFLFMPYDIERAKIV